jgi:benzoyl-CoA reductase subunit B
MDATQDRSNRLSVTRSGGQLIRDYWDNLFRAREQGKQIVWYNGGALNPIFQAAGLAWCHGEAFAARLAAQRLEGPAQLAGAEYGYNAELCSYARTHLGCSVLTLQSTEGEHSGVVGINDSQELAARLPSPDFFVNNYAGCSTGQQWDGISFRVFGKQLPIFNISHPFLWGNKPDAGYLRGEEWESASRYVAGQLRELISFLEAQTGRPFDYDALSEAMTYIKRAAELRREDLDLCQAKPAPATFWDWIACVAPINFLPRRPGPGRLLRRRQGRDQRPPGGRRLRGAGREVPAVLRRHHELEQARVLVQEIRRARRRRAVRPLHPQRVLAGAAAHRHR